MVKGLLVLAQQRQLWRGPSTAEFGLWLEWESSQDEVELPSLQVPTQRRVGKAGSGT